MSIWTSAPDNDCHGAEIGHPDTNIYQGTGALTLSVDIATAKSYHEKVRLSVWELESKPGGVDVDVLIDRDNLLRLRHQIDWALDRIAWGADQAT